MEGAKRENTSLLNREVGNMYGELEWLKVRRLAQQGLKYMKIGRELGIDRPTVKKLLLMPQAAAAFSSGEAIDSG